MSAKASAVAGAMILAGGAVVSASAGAGFGLLEQPTPTPIVEVIDDEDTGAVDLVDLGDAPAADPEVVVEVPEPDCDEEGTAREEARGRIDAAFERYDAGLDELRAMLAGKGSKATYEAIDSSDALLVEIHTEAVAALDAVGLCLAEVASIGGVAFQGAGALALVEVSDRAIAAMETVYNLARSAVLTELDRLKPTPTPKPKPTAKPTKQPEKKNPEWEIRNKERQRCDEAVYAAKKRLHAAFEEYHGANDKLIWEMKKWASDSTLKPLHRNDEILHRTYDETRQRILDAGCHNSGEASGMGLAERAEVVFRQTYEGSRGIAAAASVNKPDRRKCEEQMYAAKKVLYANYETFHGGNDRLWKVMDGFSESTAHMIKTADRIIHETYDRTKEAIYEASCGPNGSNAMELAASAAATFESAHNEARRAVGKELSAGR